MTTKNYEHIFIFGASGHAKVIIDLCEAAQKYKILGIFDLHKKKGETFCGYPVLGDESQLLGACQSLTTVSGLVAIGDNTVRQRLSLKITELVPNFTFACGLHPSAQVGARVKLGGGTVVMAGAVLNCDTQVGAGCIVNTRASLDHDCSVADFASIGPGATLGGRVRVGEGAVIGLGASVVHNITLGRHCLVGAGSVVVSDFGSHVLAYGVPARMVRERKADESYL